ncbi:pentatricopeptide repeat-containing protein [Planoprotostelium fungivorum]|uniref:Pentatricopeptide repeat-containing protein n=1 Tax=Planoprotostelium fungivorum TaxID=1890364 RepID=A0A2P6N5A4_9EUKA|nr:pentatricopeptide repeat-containing protein [Planoprotostelium fungivorum]
MLRLVGVSSTFNAGGTAKGVSLQLIQNRGALISRAKGHSKPGEGQIFKAAMTARDHRANARNEHFSSTPTDQALYQSMNRASRTLDPDRKTKEKKDPFAHMPQPTHPRKLPIEERVRELKRIANAAQEARDAAAAQKAARKPHAEIDEVDAKLMEDEKISAYVVPHDATEAPDPVKEAVGDIKYSSVRPDPARTVHVDKVNRWIQSAAHERNPDKMTTILRDMYKYGIKPNEDTWGMFISFWARRNPVKMEQYCKAMQSEGLVPRLHTWSAMIACYAHVGDTDKVMEKYRSLLETGQGPSTSILNTMMAFFAKQPHRENISNWFKSMVDAGVKPDAHTFNTLVRYGTVVDDPEDITPGEKWLKTMEKYEVKPTTSTYNILIDLFSASPKSVSFWHDEMKKRGIAEDERTWLALMKHACKHKKIKDVHRYLSIVPESTHANNLMVAYFLSGDDIKSAQEWVQKMIREQVPRSAVTYNIILKHYASMEDWERLREWSNKMTEDGIEYNAQTKAFLGLQNVSAYAAPVVASVDRSQPDPFNFL